MHILHFEVQKIPLHSCVLEATKSKLILTYRWFTFAVTILKQLYYKYWHLYHAYFFQEVSIDIANLTFIGLSVIIFCAESNQQRFDT